MGVSKYDKQAKDRALEFDYPALDSAEGVRILLSDYHALINRQYQGDYAAVDILTDLQTAIKRAGLTDRQRQVLAMVYFEDMSQVSVGEWLNLRKDTISRHLKVAETKIARVYENWARRGEGYSLSPINFEEVN